MLILELILIFSIALGVYFALRNGDVLALFFCFGFTALYVGQYFFLHYNYNINSKYISILNEYGYKRELAGYIIIYLILVFLTIGLSTYLANANNNKNRNILVNHNIKVIKVKQFFYLLALVASIFLYAQIIGWSGFLETRPNMQKGGTFGMFVCMATGISACTLWRAKRIYILNILVFFISTIVLILAGARISVIYLWLTLALIIFKHLNLRITFFMLILAVFSSIIVLIVGQAFKELTGGLVKLDSIWDSILFTVGVFYIAQTEAFVSTASTLQYQIDQASVPINGGITFLNSFNLLLPSFLKDGFTYDMSSFEVYPHSIIPSAASFFLQGFFFYGVLIHCLLIFITIFLNNKIRRMDIREDKEAYIIFVFVVSAVTLVRGPMDLYIFTIIAIGIFMYLIFMIKKILNIK
jgi:hypothetical protein